MEKILDNPTLSRSLQQARAEIRQLPPERVALAALDIGKNVHVPLRESDWPDYAPCQAADA